MDEKGNSPYETESVRDQRYVYGACCTWHGTIQEAGHTKPQPMQIQPVNGPVMNVTAPAFPCCPKCTGLLMEVESRAVWDASVAKFAEAHPEMPRYAEWMESLRNGPCIPLRGPGGDWDFMKAYKAWESKQVM